MRILAFALLIAALSVSPSHSQDGDKGKPHEKKMKKIEKSSCLKECCSDTDLAGKENTKEVRVMKEKTDDGEVVTRVTIKTVNDGKVEEKTLEGEEAERYSEEMKQEMNKEAESEGDGTVVKKIIKKEVKKKTKE